MRNFRYNIYIYVCIFSRYYNERVKMPVTQNQTMFYHYLHNAYAILAYPMSELCASNFLMTMSNTCNGKLYTEVWFNVTRLLQCIHFHYVFFFSENLSLLYCIQYIYYYRKCCIVLLFFFSSFLFSLMLLCLSSLAFGSFAI